MHNLKMFIASEHSFSNPTTRETTMHADLGSEITVSFSYRVQDPTEVV